MAQTKSLKGQIEHARVGFNRRRRKCKLTFSQICHRLKRGESLASIASAAGVGRGRMRIIYELWFRKLLQLPTAERRQQIRQAEKRKAVSRTAHSLMRRPAVQAIALEEGRRSVKSVPRRSPVRAGQISAREIYVRGRLCGVHHLRKVHRQKGRHAMYATTVVYRRPVERQDFKSFYIETPYGTQRVELEREELLAFFKSPRQQKVTLYFPIGVSWRRSTSSTRSENRAGRKPKRSSTSASDGSRKRAISRRQ